MSKVAVIIPCLPSADRQYVKPCVESLRGSGVEWDITVVCNGTKDMNPLHDVPVRGITKFFVTKQQGQCNAVNRGADAVEGDTKWLMVSNADMYYAPDWMKHLPDFDDPETPLCFSPNLVEPSDNAGSAPPFLKLNGGNDLEAFKHQEVNEFIKKQQAMQETVWETGFNLPFFIRLDVWRAIGGYDEKYDPYGSNSDTDLQTAINVAGITPMRKRDVLVYHFSSKSGTLNRAITELDQAWWNNWKYYEAKWGFNRDQLGSDVWYNQRMLPEDREQIAYQPDWKGKYVS